MKKAMIKAGELIMVIIIVIIILIAGLVGYGMFTGEQIREKGRTFESLSAVDTAQKAATTPEISCGYSPQTNTYCLDQHRLDIANQSIRNANPNSDIYNFFREEYGSATIKVNQVYPTEKQWVIYNHTANTSSEIPIRMPVYIYNSINKTNTFGYLTMVKHS